MNQNGKKCKEVPYSADQRWESNCTLLRHSGGFCYLVSNANCVPPLFKAVIKQWRHNTGTAALGLNQIINQLLPQLERKDMPDYGNLLKCHQAAFRYLTVLMTWMGQVQNCLKTL